jgi:hypothetical protein
MLLNELKSSGLYDATDHIDFCIVSDSTIDTSFQLPKTSCLFMGNIHQYERPTLLHLRKLADADEEEVMYWYIHTKGLRWFGTDRESNVIDWINLLLYWNIVQWRRAIVALETHDTYGCNQYSDSKNPSHYSGNFWWSKSTHLKTLPVSIGPAYNDPEYWVITPATKMYCVFKSGLEGMGHYYNRYPSSIYRSTDLDASNNIRQMQITIVSGHYPTDVQYAQATRRSVAAYAARHGYAFYYDDSPVDEDKRATNELHFRRCVSLQKASVLFPNTTWFVWLDSDVFVNRPTVRIEECIDLTDGDIFYHLFHEHPWSFPINTGVKFVNAKALQYEELVYSMRNTPPWNEFPWEQKVMAEYIIPRIPNKCVIHDPYVLNYLLYQPRPHHNDPAEGLFIHMCARSREQRNRIMEIFENETRIMSAHEDPSI